MLSLLAMEMTRYMAVKANKAYLAVGVDDTIYIKDVANDC